MIKRYLCKPIKITPNAFYLLGIILLVIWIEGCQRSNDTKSESDLKLPVRVEPMLICQLGPEHFGNAVYRRGKNGPRIAASGSRILEWSIQESTPTIEVVPPTSRNYDNGACAMDIDGNNIDEMIVGRSIDSQGTELLWYEEIPDQTNWKEHFIGRIDKAPGEEGIHDIMPIRIKLEDKMILGVVVIVNRKILYLYQIPEDVNQPWDQHPIADLSEYGAECAQSGLILGDIAGNGRQDLVCGNFWAECPANPATDSWKIHRYSNWDRRKTPIFPNIPAWVGDTRFGGMNQLELGDMNGDGQLDIITTDAEIPDARVGVFCRNTKDPRNLWNVTIVDTAVYCPHSLVVVDVNNDNLQDIIVGEMTAGGWWFPRNLKPKLYLYLNAGNLKFRKFILDEGRGIHMMRMAPQQTEDNHIFIFAADEIQSWYEDMTTHIIGWAISVAR